MARSFLTFSLLIILPAPALAQALDKDKLRKSAYLPYVYVGCSLNIKDLDEDGKKYDPAKEIARLTKKLDNSPKDAEIYLDLAMIHQEVKHKEERDQALAMVEKCLRPHLQTKDPKEGHLLTLYGAYVRERFPQKLDEAEQWGRRAVELAPGDWRCWEGLAWRVAQPALAALAKEAFEANEGLQFETDLKALDISPRRIQIRWHEVKQRLDEAHACYQKARGMAPDDTALLNRYLVFLHWEHPCRVVMEHVRGNATLPAETWALPEFDQLQHELARRCPNNLRYQAFALASLLKSAPAQTPTGPLDGMADMTPQRRQTCQQYIDRLEQAAAKMEPKDAVTLYSVMAYLHFMSQSKAAFYQHAKRALEIDPKLEELRLAYAMVLDSEGRSAEALEVKYEGMQANPTARAYHCTAALHFAEKNPQETEKLLRRGLELEPNDPHCQLALAAVLLWRGDQPAALDEAGRLLANVNPELPKRSLTGLPPFVGDLFRTDFEANRAIYRALRGEKASELRDVIRALLNKQPAYQPLQNVARTFDIEVSTDRINKFQLRMAARPSSPPFLLPGSNFRNRHEYRGAPVDPAQAVIDLQKQLRGVPEDAPILLGITAFQVEMGQREQVQKNSALAKEYLTALLAKEPANLFWRGQYAWAIANLGKGGQADDMCVKIARENPTDPRVWRFLGDFGFIRAACGVGFDIGFDGNEAAWQRILNPALTAPKTPHDADMAQNWIEFSGACYAKATHVAPREPDSWLALAAFSTREVSIRKQIQAARGQPFDEKQADSANARVLESFRQLSQLCPDCPYYLGGYAGAVFNAKAAIPEYRKEIEGQLAKLDQLAREKDRDTAGKCHLNAALCCRILDQSDAALRHARTALELAPHDEIAWNLAIALLLDNMQYAEVKQLVAQKVERFPTPLNHLYAGAFILSWGEIDQAEKYFREGLKRFAKDLPCILGMAAVYLSRDDKAEHLAEAERWLQKADELLGGAKNADYLRLYGIFRALRGETALGQLYLRQAVEADPTSGFSRAALQAVGP